MTRTPIFNKNLYYVNGVIVKKKLKGRFNNRGTQEWKKIEFEKKFKKNRSHIKLSGRPHQQLYTGQMWRNTNSKFKKTLFKKSFTEKKPKDRFKGCTQERHEINET